MARGRVTAAYDSWLAVPFCLVLLVVRPSTALSRRYFTAFRARSMYALSKPAMSFPMSCSFISAEIKKEIWHVSQQEVFLCRHCFDVVHKKVSALLLIYL